MNWVDWTILAILELSAAFGLFRRTVRQSIALIAVFAGAVVATNNYQQATDFLARFTPKTHVLAVVSFVALFLVVMLVVVGVAQIPGIGLNVPLLGGLDRLGGAALGVVQGLLLVHVLVWAGLQVQDTTLRSGLQGSRLALHVSSTAKPLNRLLPTALLPLAR